MNWIAIILASVATCYGEAAVSLSWQPNPEDNLLAYVVHWGETSRADSAWPGYYDCDQIVYAPTSTFTITNLLSGRRYFVSVKAMAVDGAQSDYSDEAVYVAPGVLTPRPRIDPVVRVYLEAAESPAGPWSSWQTNDFVIPAAGTNFYRSRVQIKTP